MDLSCRQITMTTSDWAWGWGSGWGWLFVEEFCALHCIHFCTVHILHFELCTLHNHAQCMLQAGHPVGCAVQTLHTAKGGGGAFLRRTTAWGFYITPSFFIGQIFRQK